jgi:hypothetical protein
LLHWAARQAGTDILAATELDAFPMIENQLLAVLPDQKWPR